MMAIKQNQKRQNQNLNSSIELKKRRVEFSDAVIIRTDFSDKKGEFSSQIFKKIVLNALDDLDHEDSSKLDTLAYQLSIHASSSDRMTPDNFSILLQLLCNNLNRVDNKKGINLIQSVINYEKWWELPSTALSNYISFLQILCSSLPKWWQDVCMLLVSNFKLPLIKTVKHHETLRYFSRAIPSSSNFIDTYISKFFPNKNDTKSNLVNYISNILKLTEYCQELRFQIWSMVIEKVISIDVELQNELDELDDDIDDDIDDIDIDDDSESDKSDTDDDEVHDNGILSDLESDNEIEGQEEYNVDISQNIKELSSKLDGILSLVTAKLSQALTEESLESGDGVNLFNTMISLFKTHILPTYYTRSVQYLMFHISQQQLELMDAFLVTLIDISFSPNETMEKKIKSLQYIGSFIARAKKLNRTQIIFISSYLTSWLNRYVLEREEEVDQPGGIERFKHFYAAFQALCYIFCFRHSLFRIDGEDGWECEIDKFFQRMVISKFNPLKYCNENVMMMFAKIAQHEGIAYCFSIIEKNNHERLRGILGKAASGNDNKVSTTWSLAARQQFIDLQSYFPYDPLFLKNYKMMMKDYYMEWSDVSGEYRSDDSDEIEESNTEYN